MPSKRKFYAIMGVATEDYPGLLLLGENILENMYGVNALLFPNPTLTKSVFESYVVKLRTAQAAMPGGTAATTKRNNAADDLRTAIRLNVISYVNQLFPDDKENQAKSGCPSSNEPQSHEKPAKPVIKDVVKVTGENSLRVRLARITSPLKKQKEKKTYILFQSDDFEGKVNLKTVCITTNSNELISKNLNRLTEYYFAVIVLNSAGESELSGRVHGAFL